MFNSTCLSGLEQIPLTDIDSCSLGFLCLNTTAENPPAFCPPTQECQAIRLQSFQNICPEPQGIYEPIVCSPGYYCPPGGREQIRCPRGHYCPQGTYDPIKCTKLSICPDGSVREISLIGFVSLAAIYLLCVISAIVSTQWKSNRASERIGARLARKKTKQPPDVEEVTENEFNEKEPPMRGDDITEEDNQGSQIGSLFKQLVNDRKMDELGLEFSFHELQYTLGGVSRPILQGISGKIRKGRMVGIMGPSGAGKSTFINILTGKTKQTAGLTTINGVQRNFTKFEHLIGFVSQDDCALADLTVRENILHSARIRLGGMLNDDKIRLHVDEMIAYLGLSHVKDRLTGSVENRGISGGERKRVCIAQEIIAMPMALILDEPTSGLDATAALSIMTLLKTLSTFGITIVCAVHQPRADIFRLLDDILLLHFGESIYTGEVAPLDAQFKALHFSFPNGYNPADAMMDVVTNQQLCSAFPWPSPQHSNSQVINWPIFSKHSMVGDSRRVSELNKSFGQQKATWYRQVLLYTLCGARQQRRQVFSFLLEMATGASAGLLMGLSVYEHKGHLFQGYFRQPFEPLSSAVNYVVVPTVGLLCSLSISLAAAPAGIKTIAEEKLIFYQEVHSGHSASAYFIGKDLATWPRILVSSLHFTTFYMILATSVIPFHVLFLLNAVYFFCIYGLASLVASFVRRQDALLLAMLASLISGILDGFGPRLELVKSWHMTWLWYICPGTWYSEAFFSEHTVPFSHIYDVDAAAKFAGYVTGRTSFDLGVIVAIGVVYRIIAYIGLVLPTLHFAFPKKLSK